MERRGWDRVNRTATGIDGVSGRPSEVYDAEPVSPVLGAPPIVFFETAKKAEASDDSKDFGGAFKKVASDIAAKRD
jgi:hypothetical protein